MEKSMIGIHDPEEIDKHAQEVPKGCGCSTCLMQSCECRKGSLYQPNTTGRGDKCASWMYYD